MEERKNKKYKTHASPLDYGYMIKRIKFLVTICKNGIRICLFVLQSQFEISEMRFIIA